MWLLEYPIYIILHYITHGKCSLYKWQFATVCKPIGMDALYACCLRSKKWNLNDECGFHFLLFTRSREEGDDLYTRGSFMYVMHALTSTQIRTHSPTWQGGFPRGCDCPGGATHTWRQWMRGSWSDHSNMSGKAIISLGTRCFSTAANYRTRLEIHQSHHTVDTAAIHLNFWTVHQTCCSEDSFTRFSTLYFHL